MKKGSRQKQVRISCGEVCDDLYLYISGELGADDANRIRKHLADCLACRIAMRQHLELAAAMKRWMPGLPLSVYSADN